MFFTYRNCKFLINGNPVYAPQATINWQGKPEPSYIIDKQYNESYVPSDGINGVLSFSYFLTGQDAMVDNINDPTQPIEIKFGNLTINSGYLKKYSFGAIPNSPVLINSDILFFDNLTGTFSPSYEDAQELVYLNIGDATISSVLGSNSIGQISNITKLNYNYDIDIKPQYQIGEILPKRIVFGIKNVNVDFSSDKIDNYISISGNKTAFRTKLIHPTDTGIFQSFDCKGVLYQKNLESSAGNLLNSVYFIKQNDLTAFNSLNQQAVSKPNIYSIIPTTGYYGAFVTISGKNLSLVSNVAFSNSVYDTSFQIVNDNQIISVVPNGAISGPITLYTDMGSTTSNQIFLIGGLPISINAIIPITGNIGSKILISGDNFYEISNVIFGNNANSSFNRISKNLIEATVPHNSSWGKIYVISSGFDLSGISSNEFVPNANIFGFTPNSGMTGEFIVLSGESFIGITGAKINNLPTGNTEVFFILYNTGILLQIPSGNTKGLIKLYGQSGITDLSVDTFYPYAKITGIVPSSGITGTLIGISGQNFLPEILYNFGNNLFAVAFEKNITGYFRRINNTLLTGTIPSGAISGLIHIVSPLQDQYSSSTSFNVLHDVPRISYINPISGRYQDNISVIGNNFFDIDNIILTGHGTGQKLTSNFSVSNTNDYINFIIPNITGGIYSIVINAMAGSVSGNNLLTILDKPYISGYLPLSGGPGYPINISGLNIYYGLTKIYIDDTAIITSIDSGSFSNSNNNVSFYMPNGLSNGAHKIILNNSVDYATGVPDFNFIPTPIITGFFPLSGQWGNIISVTGDFFNTVNEVRIGETNATGYSIVNSNKLTIPIPNNTSSDFIRITNAGGKTISNDKLIVTPPLIIIHGFDVTPTYFNSGLFISGSYLSTTKEIVFSGVSGDNQVIVTDFTNIGDTGIQVNIAPGITSGPIKLVNTRGFSFSSQTLNIIPDAFIATFNPVTGVSGDIISIEGNTLSGSIVYFKSAGGALIEANNMVFVNDTGVQVSVPHEIISDTISVQGRNKSLISSTGIFTVLPTISGVSGIHVYATGDFITITGINAYDANFVGISGNNSGVYDILYPNSFTNDLIYFTGISDFKTGYSLITIRTNSSFAGTGKLFLGSLLDTELENSVTGSITYSQRNKVIFNTPITISQPAPIITSFSPTGGGHNSIINIFGDNLLSANNVLFSVNGVYSFGTILGVTNTQISVKPPFVSVSSSGTGLLYVTTPFGTVSTGRFILYPLLSISGYTPTNGHTGDYIRISGSGLFGATGVRFGSFPAQFNTVNEFSTVIMSGIVPPDYDCCGQTVQICVSNQGEEYCL